MTLEIIGIPRSNFVRTVRMAAHEKGVAYRLNPAKVHSKEVTAINPLGLVPAMRHDGLELAESQAIARYIDTAFDGPPLTPLDPRAAAPVNQWVSMVAASVDQLLMRRYVVEYAFHKDENGDVVRDVIDKSVQRFPRMFAMLDNAAAGGFLGGDSFSMADCFLMPILASTRLFPEGDAHLTQSTNLNAYFKRLSQRPSFLQTAP